MTVTINFSYAWWWIPTFITVAGIFWATVLYDRDNTSSFSAIGSLFMLVPVLGVSCVAWIIAGILK